ncbi:hypothetical protein OK016_29330 [Vibrio chagasii]|nr:hypothetical protein [Vibrio chagasii]
MTAKPLPNELFHLALPRVKHTNTGLVTSKTQQVDLKRQPIFSINFTAEEFAAFLTLPSYGLLQESS